MVTAADVARVRAGTAPRKVPWTLPELEATLPRLLDPQQWKMTASHGGNTATGASSLRGWSTGAPESQGMWFTVELPQPATVTEVQFDSAVSSGRRGRGGPAAPAARRGGPGEGAPPVVGYPRSYGVQVSADGTAWSKPVAEGKGWWAAHVHLVRAGSGEIRAAHADRPRGRRAGVVDQESADLRGAGGQY